MKHKGVISVSSSLAANHTSSPHSFHAFTSKPEHLIRNRQASSVPEELASASNSSSVNPSCITGHKENSKCRVVQNQSISQETLHKLLITTASSRPTLSKQIWHTEALQLCEQLSRELTFACTDCKRPLLQKDSWRTTISLAKQR